MDFFERELFVDGPAAAVISAGMRAVAKADGDVHPREMALIEAFEADLPATEHPDPRGALASHDLRSAYARTLVMVALADGVISAEEDRVIRELCGSLGVADADVDTAIDEVKHWFIERFAGVTVFRDSVEAIARDLGVDAPG